jgi:hypothetical protein
MNYVAINETKKDAKPSYTLKVQNLTNYCESNTHVNRQDEIIPLDTKQIMIMYGKLPIIICSIYISYPSIISRKHFILTLKC